MSNLALGSFVVLPFPTLLRIALGTSGKRMVGIIIISTAIAVYARLVLVMLYLNKFDYYNRLYLDLFKFGWHLGEIMKQIGCDMRNCTTRNRYGDVDNANDGRWNNIVHLCRCCNKCFCCICIGNNEEFIKVEFRNIGLLTVERWYVD